MLTMEAGGNYGGGKYGGFLGCGKGEINGRQWYDNQWDIVLVIFTKISFITWPPFPSSPCMVESPVN